MFSGIFDHFSLFSLHLMKNLGKWWFGPAMGVRGIHLLVGIHSTLFPFLFPLSIYSIFFLSFVFSSSIFFLFVRETGNGGKAINLISGNELRKNYFYFHVFTSLHNGPENCGHFFLLLLLLLWTRTTLVQFLCQGKG